MAGSGGHSRERENTRHSPLSVGPAACSGFAYAPNVACCARSGFTIAVEASRAFVDRRELELIEAGGAFQQRELVTRAGRVLRPVLGNAKPGKVESRQVLALRLEVAASH